MVTEVEVAVNLNRVTHGQRCVRALAVVWKHWLQDVPQVTFVKVRVTEHLVAQDDVVHWWCVILNRC